jgi:hypothetical protein
MNPSANQQQVPIINNDEAKPTIRQTNSHNIVTNASANQQQVPVS